MNFTARVVSCLADRDLVDITRSESGHVWHFHFTGDVRLSVECSWRILAEGRIAHAARDHDQLFGLPKPVNGVERSNSYLRNKPVQRVDVRDDSGDLAITFANQCVLEVLNDSSGYEGWQLDDGLGFVMIALGGGELRLWDKSK